VVIFNTIPGKSITAVPGVDIHNNDLTGPKRPDGQRPSLVTGFILILAG
jgi:hypothetical protein